jgi:hypothetical protein
MAERRDYLPVCNDNGVPLPDFQAMFCVRCVQPECSRSRSGGLFETRVASWEDRLFKDPPRMEKSDPLYAALTAKRFIEIDVGRVPEVGGRSDWVDPRALDEPKTPTRKPRKAKSTKAAELPKELETPKEPPPARVERSSAARAPRNTEFRQGTLLGEPGKTATPVDPWAAPPPAAPSTPPVPLVQVGAKIRFK